MEGIEGIEGMVTGYLTRRNTSFEKSGDTYSVRWLDDSSVFSEGWTVEVIRDEFFDGLMSTVKYKIRGVENDALLDEKWMEISERHPGVFFIGGASDRSLSGEAVLSSSDIVGSNPAELMQSLDCSFRELLEAVYSLMSLYEKKYLHLEGDILTTRFSCGAKAGLEVNCLPDPASSKTACTDEA